MWQILRLHLGKTDHKPLVPLLGSKHLDHHPPWILKLQLRLARYMQLQVHCWTCAWYAVVHSRRTLQSSVSNVSKQCTPRRDETLHRHGPRNSSRTSGSTTRLPTSPKGRFHMLLDDQILQWSLAREHNIYPELQPYWENKANLTVVDDILLHNFRIVVPAALQKETLSKIHQGHLGIQKCQVRARNSVW